MQQETILALLKKATAFFEEKGIGEARRSAELLLAHVLQCDRLQLFLRFEQPLLETELEAFRALVRRRSRHEPLQYIIGQTEFYGLQFIVNPSVLIPRPETEHLVEAVIDFAKTFPSLVSILDIGTGSGCIAVTLAKHLASSTITCIDVSDDALRLAKTNGERNHVIDKLSFVKMDFLSDDAMKILNRRFHVIVSNPPYISKSEIDECQPEVRDYEPRIATTDAADGLTFYRRIASAASSLLDSKNGIIAVEIGFGQRTHVEEIFSRAGFNDVTTIRDYSGIERVIVMRSGRSSEEATAYS